MRGWQTPDKFGHKNQLLWKGVVAWVRWEVVIFAVAPFLWWRISMPEQRWTFLFGGKLKLMTPISPFLWPNSSHRFLALALLGLENTFKQKKNLFSFRKLVKIALGKTVLNFWKTRKILLPVNQDNDLDQAAPASVMPPRDQAGCVIRVFLMLTSVVAMEVKQWHRKYCMVTVICDIGGFTCYSNLVFLEAITAQG